jgi:hypothetical protein
MRAGHGATDDERATCGRCARAPFKLAVDGEESEASWQIRIGVVGQKARGRVVVDERVVDEPLDRAALGAGVTECPLCQDQVRQDLM